MAVYEIDPLTDLRWPELLQRDDRAGIFHTPSWLEALRRSYGYVPTVVTDSPPGHSLEGGIALCRINSWLTGTRLVSLPFSDHCEPLIDQPAALTELISFLCQMLKQERLKYIELRPLSYSGHNQAGLCEAESFCFHTLDLRPSLSALFCNLHKNSFQRKIRRAEREKLTYERGNSLELATKFYSLFTMTRKRHGLPPPPFLWIRTLLHCLGPASEIRIISKDGHPVAGMLTLTYKNTITYKYGGFDARFNKMGGTAFLFWRMITEAKADGIHTLDLGRCDLANDGLIRYKDRLGSKKSLITYWRAPLTFFPSIHHGWQLKMVKQLFSCTPEILRVGLGNRLYKHAG